MGVLVAEPVVAVLADALVAGVLADALVADVLVAAYGCEDELARSIGICGVFVLLCVP